ncbi:MAG: hypothetical protein Q7U74_00335 [Saprospiraceae bacterium]|nr:hypothetical protein [Saprospiraceae bacterium]
MKFHFGKTLGLIVLTISVCKSTAQPSYTGSRVALFDIQILQQKGPNLQIRCRMANTGRQMIGAKNPELAVEFDHFGMPGLLRGHEIALAEAARNNCPKLKPGELSAPIWLSVRLQSRTQASEAEPGACAELVFDTAFVENWGTRSMQLRFFLRNTGTAPANFFAKNMEPLVKLYFVSGTKLTRGAIPAGSTSIQKGRETLDGLLFPGEVLEGSVEIPLKDRSKFSPNIALEFDPAQAVDECSRGGNIWVVPLRY